MCLSVKNLPANSGDMGLENTLGEEMATHWSILAWEIPWTEEPGGLQSMGLQRVRHDLATKQLYSPWDSPGQNTGVDSLPLLQGIVPTQGSNPGFLHCRRILYQLSHKGSPKQQLCSSRETSQNTSTLGNFKKVDFLPDSQINSIAVRIGQKYPHQIMISKSLEIRQMLIKNEIVTLERVQGLENFKGNF